MDEIRAADEAIKRLKRHVVGTGYALTLADIDDILCFDYEAAYQFFHGQMGGDGFQRARDPLDCWLDPQPPVPPPSVVQKAPAAGKGKKKGASNAFASLAEDPPASGAEPASGAAAAAASMPRSLDCELCRVKITSEKAKLEHERGKKHRAAMSSAQANAKAAEEAEAASRAEAKAAAEEAARAAAAQAAYVAAWAAHVALYKGVKNRDTVSAARLAELERAPVGFDFAALPVHERRALAEVWGAKLRNLKLQELESRMNAYQAAQQRLDEAHDDVKNNVLRKVLRP